jgi:hypothetical protein
LGGGCRPRGGSARGASGRPRLGRRSRSCGGSAGSA